MQADNLLKNLTEIKNEINYNDNETKKLINMLNKNN